MKLKTKKEIRRKSIHVIPGILGPVVVLLPAYFFGDLVGRVTGIIISSFFLAIYSLNQLYLSGRIKREIPIATQTFRRMAREVELEKKSFMGPIYFWAITTLLLIFLNLEVAIAGVWISSIGDASAAIVGSEFGQTKIPYNKRKSVEGSFAFFISAFIGTYLILLLSPPIYYNLLVLAIGASFIGAILESLPGSYLLDEITVPLIPPILIQLLGGYQFQIFEYMKVLFALIFLL